jgi:hypothetical protein
MLDGTTSRCGRKRICGRLVAISLPLAGTADKKKLSG